MAKVQLIKEPLHATPMRKYSLPSGMGYCVRSIVMRELVSADDITAAINAEKFGPGGYDKLETGVQISQREKIRLSLVEVDGKRVNTDGLPYMAFDGWNAKTVRFVEKKYHEMNGITEADIEVFNQRGELVDPSALAPLADEEDTIGRPSSG